MCQKVNQLKLKKCSFIFLIALLFLPNSKAQFEGLLNTLTGPQSLMPGIKNLMGGVLAVDKVHKKCVQKTLCDQFAPPVIETRAEFDPVKRSLVLVPRVIKERGKLRWIGDMIVNFFSGVMRRMGVTRYWRRYENRRQSGIPVPIIIQAIQLGVATFQKIPVERMIHVFDVITDATPIMERSGAVYPYVRATTLGYGFGDKRNDNLKDGVCSQISGDCPDSMWEHLETANEYEAPIGKISQRNSVPSEEILRTRSASKPVDANTWNFMEPRDLLNPRVFLCKAGRFVENVVKKNMKTGEDTPTIVKETYYNEKFQESCDEHELDQFGHHLDDEFGSGSGDDCNTFTDEELQASVVSNSDLVTANKCRNQTLLEDGSGQDEGAEQDNLEVGEEDNDKNAGPRGIPGGLPILVFEGLEKPKDGETDEDIVTRLLMKSTNLTAVAVRRAIRLPMLQENSLKSLVLVELDTMDHENQVIKGRDNIVKKRKIEVRKAKYKELWKYIEELTIVKRLASNNEVEDSTSTDDDSVKVVFRTKGDSKDTISDNVTQEPLPSEPDETTVTGERPPSLESRPRSSKILFT